MARKAKPSNLTEFSNAVATMKASARQQSTLVYSNKHGQLYERARPAGFYPPTELVWKRWNYDAT